MSSDRHSIHPTRWSSEDGIAALIALIALSIFTLFGLSMTLNSTTEIRVSDNYESQIQASNAALAGLHHGRELLRGIRFDDILVGPDGAADTSTSYLTQARTPGFRNPMGWNTGRSLNMLDPSSYLAGIPDDGDQTPLTHL